MSAVMQKSLTFPKNRWICRIVIHSLLKDVSTLDVRMAPVGLPRQKLIQIIETGCYLLTDHSRGGIIDCDTINDVSNDLIWNGRSCWLLQNIDLLMKQVCKKLLNVKVQITYFCVLLQNDILANPPTYFVSGSFYWLWYYEFANSLSGLCTKQFC